jgi:hypothetical protein
VTPCRYSGNFYSKREPRYQITWGQMWKYVNIIACGVEKDGAETDCKFLLQEDV